MTTQQTGETRGGIITLILAAFCANAAIMTLELVAGRLVARYLGQSLYTWTAIIAVVLSGMAIGSYLAGRLRDHGRPARLLSILMMLATVACAVIPLLNDVVGSISILRGLSWPVRIMTHTALVFLLPSMFLGSVTPLLLRVALHASTATGRVIGLIYAATASGSIAGTFATGFWLIPTFGTRLIVFGTGVVVAVLAVYFALQDRKSVKVSEGAVTPDDEETVNWHRGFVAALIAVFLSNSGFMILELSGSRMATAQLGHSIYTWTSLLGVVLAGITVGNFLGGRAADRYEPRALVPRLLTLAGVLVLLVPSIHAWISSGTLLEDLSWPARTFLHIGIVFFVPSLAIGTIGPAAATVAITRGGHTGKVVGIVYATGAIASVTGTLLTGYWLVDWLWPIGTVTLLALTFSLAAIVYGGRHPLQFAAVGASGVAAIIALAPFPALQSVGESIGLREAGTDSYLYVDHSQYSWIGIGQPVPGSPTRSMYLDQLVHSTADIEDPFDLHYEYTQAYVAIVASHFGTTTPVRASILGGGGFVLPRYLELTRPGSYIETVEIDPGVTEAAHAAFGFPRDTSVAVYNMDARNRIDDIVRSELDRADFEAFDCVFGDSFNQYSVPFPLTTIEFVEQIDAMLSERGLYLFNLIDSMQHGAFLASSVRTCRAVFPYVYVLSTDELYVGRDTFIIVAARVPVQMDRALGWLRRDVGFLGRMVPEDQLDALISKHDAPILTDDFAPVDNMIAPLMSTKRSARTFRLRNQASQLLHEKKYDEAIPLLEDLSLEAPNDIEVLRNLGLIHAKKGELEEALPYYRRALAIRPDSHELLYNVGLLHERLGNEGLARAHLEAANQSEPDNPRTALAYASVLIGLQELQSAERVLAQATATDSPDLEALFMLGNVRAMSKDFARARLAFEQALAIQPEFVGARVNLGNVLFNLGENTAAREQFMLVVQADAEHAAGWYLLGLTFERNGELENAAGCFERALILRPAMQDAAEALERVRAP